MFHQVCCLNLLQGPAVVKFDSTKLGETDTRQPPLYKTSCITTREKASSSACFRCISSAGTGATNKALQLTRSSRACSPALLLYKCSSSALLGSSLLIIALARVAWTRYCYRDATANFSPLATANFSSFCIFFYIFVLYLNRLYTRIFSRYKCHHDTHTNGCETTNVIIAYTYK